MILYGSQQFFVHCHSKKIPSIGELYWSYKSQFFSNTLKIFLVNYNVPDTINLDSCSNLLFQII